MKKLTTLGVAALMAVSPTAAFASDDNGEDINPTRIYHEIMCNLFGIQSSCDWLDDNPPAPVGGPGAPPVIQYRNAGL